MDGDVLTRLKANGLKVVRQLVRSSIQIGICTPITVANDSYPVRDGVGDSFVEISNVE